MNSDAKIREKLDASKNGRGPVAGAINTTTDAKRRNNERNGLGDKEVFGFLTEQ